MTDTTTTDSPQTPSDTPPMAPPSAGTAAATPGQPAAAATGPAPAATPARHRRGLPLLTAVALLLAGAGAWWTLHARAAVQAAPMPRATAVAVGVVQQRDMPVTVSALGTITAANTAVVHARVSGPLLALKFQEGQAVQAGQVLALIDPEPLRIALAQAEATLARDQALLANARADLARYQGLVAQDAAPRQQLDTQTATVRQLEATVQADDAARRSAQLQLSYTTVTAPIAGVAGLKQVDVGNTVNPTDANGIVSIAQMRPAAVVFAVPADQLPALRAQQRAAAATAGRPAAPTPGRPGGHLHAAASGPSSAGDAGQPLRVQAWDRSAAHLLAQGQVASIDNLIDSSTGTVKVKALFPNADGSLFPNQPVSVSLQLGTLPQALALPSAAVLRGAHGAYVFEVGDDNRVLMRPVQVLANDGSFSAVQASLQAGSRVVVDGSDRLRDGALVTVVDPSAQAAGAAAISSAGRGPRRDGTAVAERSAGAGS